MMKPENMRSNQVRPDATRVVYNCNRFLAARFNIYVISGWWLRL